MTALFKSDPLDEPSAPVPCMDSLHETGQRRRDGDVTEPTLMGGGGGGEMNIDVEWDGGESEC